MVRVRTHLHCALQRSCVCAQMKDEEDELRGREIGNDMDVEGGQVRTKQLHTWMSCHHLHG